MPSNKDRLYVGLHARAGKSKMPGGEDKYHWALLIGPKREAPAPGVTVSGKRIHAKERIEGDGSGTSSWVYAEEDVDMSSVFMLLARVQIAKIRDTDGLLALLRQVPIRGGEPGWNCIGWVKEALQVLKNNDSVMGRSSLEWQSVRDTAMWYVDKKAADHRFDGNAEPGQFDMARVPTYDTLQNTETVS